MKNGFREFYFKAFMKENFFFKTFQKPIIAVDSSNQVARACQLR